METLKNLLGVAVYVMLSCVTVSIIFGGVAISTMRGRRENGRISPLLLSSSLHPLRF